MSIPVSLKNKGGNEKSCWKFGKDCALCLQRFQSMWKAIAKSLHSLIGLVYLIKLVGCMWDKLFDLEDIEKPILNFARFCTLS